MNNSTPAPGKPGAFFICISGGVDFDGIFAGQPWDENSLSAVYDKSTATGRKNLTGPAVAVPIT